MAPFDQGFEGPSPVVVIGGGVVGLACAWGLARAGGTVILLDPAPGRGASWVAAGMLAPVSETHYGDEALVQLLLEGAAAWPAFATELEAQSGQSVGLRTTGTVTVGLDASDRAFIEDLVALQESLGLSVRRLTARRCRELVRGLSPAVAGGAEMPQDHQVDNRRLVAALEAGCRAAGVVLVNRRAESVMVHEGRAAGVRLEDGTELQAEAVLVAAGAASGSLSGLAPGTIPSVRPVKGQLLRLAGSPRTPVLDRTVRGVVQGRTCYLVPRADGTVVVGATVEERGFDRSVRAGPIHDLLHDALRLVPGLDDLEIKECLAELRPGTPDNGPYLGWSRLPGLAVATGHYRNGILLAPLTATAVVALLGGGEVPEVWRRFAPGRLTARVGGG